MSQLMSKTNIRQEMIEYHTRRQDANLRAREFSARQRWEKQEYWARANEHTQMVKFWENVVLSDE